LGIDHEEQSCPLGWVVTFEAIQVKFRGKARGFAKSKCEFSECMLRKIYKEQRYREKRHRKLKKKDG
jgi:hypothetical protein